MNTEAPVHLIYFSPTETSRSVLRLITQFMKVETAEHDLTPNKPYSDCTALGSQDFAIFGFPIYELRVPRLFRERLSSVSGSGTPAAVVCTYGNREYGDALLEICDLVRARGFVPIAAAAVVAEHNVNRSVATGRPDASDLKFIERFGAELAICRQALAINRQTPTETSAVEAALTVPGNRPYRSLPFSLPWHRVIQTTSDCIDCGVCSAGCPVGAIDAADPHKTLPTCIGCMRCIRKCSKQARQLTRPFKIAANLFLSKAKRTHNQPEMWFL